MQRIATSARQGHATGIAPRVTWLRQGQPDGNIPSLSETSGIRPAPHGGATGAQCGCSGPAANVAIQDERTSLEIP